MCTSVSSLCYVQCVFKSGHVLFGEAAPGPAPSKEHPRMLEIDPTSRLIEEFKYLIATILREWRRGARYHYRSPEAIVDRRLQGAYITGDHEVGPEEANPIHVWDVEELLKAFSHTQLIIIQRSDAKVTVCDPTASGAIGGRTNGNAGARLLPNEATDDSLRDRVGVEQPARVDVASTRGSSKSKIHPARAPGTGERVPQVVQKDERSGAESSAHEN